jgi:transcriptional regulator with XRE-family HTH domain
VTTKPTPPTPDEIRALREARGETQLEFARAIGVPGGDQAALVTVSRWERDVRTPGAWYSMRLRELMEATTPPPTP